MIGSFLTRGLVIGFGYAFPAYECFKTVEMNKPDIQQLRFWCQYWILVAVLTVCERFSHAFISWVPMYSEAKLAFFIYLWCPKTKGTTYVYDSFFRPVVLSHEKDIDRNLLELRTRAGDMAFLYWQKAASYSQTRIFEILQYVTSRPIPARAAQPQNQSSRGRQPTAIPNHRSTAPAAPNPRSTVPAPQGQTEKQASPSSTESTSEIEPEAIGGLSPAAALKAQKATPTKALAETTRALSSIKSQVLQLDSVPSSSNESAKSSVETVMEEAVRVTRARSRKAGTSSNP